MSVATWHLWAKSKAAADHLVRLLTDATPNAKWADMVNTTYQSHRHLMLKQLAAVARSTGNRPESFS